MGEYVNPGSEKFQMALRSEIYIDKSELITETNRLFNTKQRYICLSRPRRFGKTMAMEMLAAYYGAGDDAEFLFDKLDVSKSDCYKDHLNQHNVIVLNIQEFLIRAKSIDGMMKLIEEKVTEDLQLCYPELPLNKAFDFIQVMKDTYRHSKKSFVFLIDEWDCLFRIHKEDSEGQRRYLDFLQVLLKDQIYVGLAYMTGILPIKKYGSESALNMFREYSMLHPRQFTNYFGFTENEVQKLAKKYNMPFAEFENWYNGYFKHKNTPIYNPTSVSEALMSEEFSNYWSKTETFESLKNYINSDFHGLKEKVAILLANEEIEIQTGSFTNDMKNFNNADDILTLLVHLGYLTFDIKTSLAKIPNEEVRQEFVTSIKNLEWNNVLNLLNDSKNLLQAIWDKNEQIVAEGLGKAHEENISILAYNNESSLSAVLSLALYYARDYYHIIREFPTGKGFSDMVFYPRIDHLDKPVIVVELKWDKTAESAIEQIKERNYVSKMITDTNEVILVGINYDKKTKVHQCKIEMWGEL